MKHVSVNVGLIPVFVISKNAGMMINAYVNAKNWLMKAYAIKDLSGTPSNCECKCYKSCAFNEHLDYKDCKWKKG